MTVAASVLDFLDELNWLAVVVAWLAAFAIGFVWYLPPVLGRAWAARVAGYTRMSEQELMSGSPVRPIAMWLVGMLVNAIVLALLVEATNAGAGAGLVLGIAIWLGFGATFSSWPVIFARQPWDLWAINNGAFLLMQAVAGLILGAWR